MLTLDTIPGLGLRHTRGENSGFGDGYGGHSWVVDGRVFATNDLGIVSCDGRPIGQAWSERDNSSRESIKWGGRVWKARAENGSWFPDSESYADAIALIVEGSW